jgi:hypothetical protein
MIYLLPLKAWKKLDKKIAKAKDFELINGLGNDDDETMGFNYSSAANIDQLAPDKKLFAKYAGKDDILLSEWKSSKSEEKFLKGKGMTSAVLVITYIVVDNEDQKNVIVVLSNKTYKYFGEKILKRFNKVIKTDVEFAKLGKGLGKKDFAKDMKKSDIKELTQAYNKAAKQYTKEKKYLAKVSKKDV